MELQDAIDGYLLFKSGKASPATLKTDKVLCRQFSRWATSRELGTVEDVKPKDVVGYLNYQRSRGLAESTVRRHYALLSALWSWLTSPGIALVDKHIVEPVPIPKEPKRVVKILSQEDIGALLDAASETEQPRRDRAFILFLLDTCCRVSEAANVELPQVDIKTGKVLVTGKGNKQRFTYLGTRALQALWLYLKQERPEPLQLGSKHVFLSRQAYPMDRHSLRKIVYRLSEAANVRAYPHLFRHTGAYLRLRAGMDLISLQHLLGHSKLET
ncbi:MAG: tyrosine-type recombinase/integrase, partial [Anaerolineae bacterium]